MLAGFPIYLICVRTTMNEQTPSSDQQPVDPLRLTNAMSAELNAILGDNWFKEVWLPISVTLPVSFWAWMVNMAEIGSVASRYQREQEGNGKVGDSDNEALMSFDEALTRLVNIVVAESRQSRRPGRKTGK